MKMKMMLVMVYLLALPVMAFAGSSSTSNASAGAEAVTGPSSASIDFTINNPPQPPGMNRQIPQSVQPQYGPVLPYFGTYGKGWNILDDIRAILPPKGMDPVITMQEAKNMVAGSTKVKVRLLKKLDYSFETCRVYANGTIPEKYIVIGVVFAQAKGETTIDALGAALLAAMEAGGNAVIPLKNTADPKVSSWGVGLGLAYTRGGLSGSEKESLDSGSGGTGIAYSSVTPELVPGVTLLVIQDEKGIAGTKKAGLASPKAELPSSQKDSFKCISTSTHQAPAECFKN